MAAATAGAWEKLPVGLHPVLLDTLNEDFKFPTMTPVQANSIPLFLSHHDVVVEACTGSGKTLAFMIPIVQFLLSNPAFDSSRHSVGAIIILPTRELALQVCEVAMKLTKHTRLVVQTLVGGTEQSEDISKLKEQGGNILVCTPGRLSDILSGHSSGVLQVRDLEVLILDEADRLLDMGFQGQINSILERLPKQRRTGLFSATQTEELRELVRAGLRNPKRVTVRVEASKDQGSASQKTPSQLQNKFVVVEQEQKLAQLIAFLNAYKDQKVIVYFLTCSCVDYFSKVLTSLPSCKGLELLSLHGQMVQKKRAGLYKKFVDLKAGILLCTDVAARGLDIPDVDCIIQFDAPQDPNVFVHRIGRTARMGRTGCAFVFLTPDEDNYVEFLEVRKVPIVKTDPLPITETPFEEIRALAAKDRDVMEKGQQAFVSYIRAYREHHCSYIFRMEKLDFGKLGHSFGLLRLPMMSETAKANTSFLVPAAVDYSAIPYSDKVREKARILRKEKEDAGEMSSRQKKIAKEIEKREQRKMKTEKLNSMPVRQRKKEVKHHEVEELNKEARLLKKLKNGQITEAQFDRQMYGDDEEEEAEEKGSEKEKASADQIDDGDALKPKKKESKQQQQQKKGKQQQKQKEKPQKKAEESDSGISSDESEYEKPMEDTPQQKAARQSLVAKILEEQRKRAGSESEKGGKRKREDDDAAPLGKKQRIAALKKHWQTKGRK